MSPHGEAPASASTDETFSVVLIDFDNLRSLARDGGWQLSWRRLATHLRSLGKVFRMEVFVPPKTIGDAVKGSWHFTHRILDSAGFRVIFCPMAYKDKDSVDAHILTSAYEYLMLTMVKRVIVVSQDRDFVNLITQAANLHKEVLQIDPTMIRPDVEGEDDMVEVRETKIGIAARHALGLLTKQEGEPSDEEQRWWLSYYVAILHELNTAALPPSRFHALRDHLAGKMRAVVGGSTYDKVKAALTRLNDAGMLTRQDDQVPPLYELNRSHPIVMAALGQEPPKVKKVVRVSKQVIAPAADELAPGVVLAIDPAVPEAISGPEVSVPPPPLL